MTTRNHLRAIGTILLATMAAAFHQQIRAATVHFDGGNSTVAGNGRTWSAAVNWAGDNGFAVGDDLVFGKQALASNSTITSTQLGNGSYLAISNSGSVYTTNAVRSLTFSNELGQFPTATGTLIVQNSNAGTAFSSVVVFNTPSVDMIKLESGNLTFTSRTSSANLTMNLAYTGMANIAVASGSTLSIDNTGLATAPAALSGTGGITKTGSGTLAIVGNSNTFTGGLTIAEGVLIVNSFANFGSASGAGVTVNGGTLRFSGGTANSASSRVFSVGNVTGTFDIDSGVTTRISGNITNVSGQIGALTKTGLGTLTLNGTVNTYSGLTTVNNGLLVFGISGGTGGLPSGNGLTIGANGGADFQNAGQTLGAVSNSNTAANSLNFSNTAGTVTLSSLGGVGNTRFGANATITGGVSSGTVTTVGLLTANITGGTVSAGSLSAATVSGGNTTVVGIATIGTMSAGSATLSGATSSINNLTGGNLTLGSSSVLTVGGGTFNGSLSGGQGLYTTGNFTFGSSSSSSFSGAVNVGTGQTLVVNGNLSSSSVSVAFGATLAGSGTVAGGATIQAGGTLAPGNSPGLITFSGDLVFNDVDAKSVFEINGTARGTGYDAVNISGALTYNGDLTVNFGYTPSLPPDADYNLFDFATLSGNFDSISIAGTYTASLSRAGNLWSGTDAGATVSFSFDQTNGVLTVAAIPEPSTFAALAGFGVVGIALFRRRRHCVTK